MGKVDNTRKNRTRKKSRFNRKMGKAPGTISYLGSREGVKSIVNILEYNEGEYRHLVPGDIDQMVSHKQLPTTSWIDIIGLSDEPFIERVGKRFGLNPLIMEDAVNTLQRPKIDEFDDYIFGVFKMIYINADNQMVWEHVALVLIDDCVLVFQELEDDVFSGVRERIIKKTGRIRSRGADYLFFALLDAIIDHYFLVLEHINDKIEMLEEEVYDNPIPEVAQRIQQLKKQVLKVRRWIFPVKDIVNRLLASEHPLISKDTKFFLKDALDHSTGINDSLEIYREMSMNLTEMYMGHMSNKMNEVMKVLTIMASIFIPLTFIAGIYGMNFEHMPELHWEYGYYMLWGIMFLLFIGMLIYFKRKGWL